MNDYIKRQLGLDAKLGRTGKFALYIIGGIFILGLLIGVEDSPEERFIKAVDYKRQYLTYDHTLESKWESAAVAPLLTGSMHSQYQLMY